MRALLVGRSAIGQRRILPALAAVGCAEVEVVSGRCGPGDLVRLIEASKADLVYVSTVNSSHDACAEAALNAGRHVVVDKPIATTHAATVRLLALARLKGLLLAEAVVWAYHPQVEAVLSLLQDSGAAVSAIVAAFSYPRHAQDNFRHYRNLGGGALLDLGPYAVSPGRVFFREAPERVGAASLTPSGSEVESAFDVWCRYSDGAFCGHFDTASAYLNRLDLIGPEVIISLEPAFTSAPDQPLRIEMRERDGRRSLAVPAADAFACFLTQVCRAIRSNCHDNFYRAIEMDGAAMESLRVAARSRPEISAVGA